MRGGGLFRPRLVFSASRRDAGRGKTTTDAERFRDVMMPHMDSAYTLARALTRDPTAAEDIVQEAFLRAYRSFSDWRGEAPKAWLLAIVRNCFLNSVSTARSRARTHDIDDLAADPPPELIDRADPESLLAGRSEAAMLRAVIDQLPEPFREALVLRELEEMSYKDIAAIARVPIGTVMSRLARARQMLGDLLIPGDEKEARA
jgi:RNA polymerase sigma factor (sigma-70 family)